MNKYLKLLKSYISCYLNIPFLYGHLSYSQEGEDVIIDRYFKTTNIKKGFYVDIGAFHPFKYSNTQKLYQQGWCGINIEPNRNNWKLLNFARKRDLNLNFGIGNSNSKKIYYTFSDPALNTFNKDNFKAIVNSNQSIFIDTFKVKVIDPKHLIKIIKKTISEYSNSEFLFKKNIFIHLLNIDAEGYSENILRLILKSGTNPLLVCVEREKNMGKPIIGNESIISFMSRYKYSLYSATPQSYIFVKI